MKKSICSEAIYLPSKDLVARKIEGEFIVVPLDSGLGDLEGALFSINEIGWEIWKKLDGKRTLEDVVKDLAVQFDASFEVIEGDVFAFVDELVKRKILIEAPE